MKLQDFDYNLPKELIAQKPKVPRDSSRLLVFNRENHAIEHRRFFNIIDYLEKGDILVLNNSKVFPARLIGKKVGTGGKIEVFLLHNQEQKIWQCLVGGSVRQENLAVQFLQGLNCKIKKNNNDGTWLVEFNKNKTELMKIAERIGQVPTPPYIKKLPAGVKQKYQTVFAGADKVGSVAAPTAGLHFTKSLLKKIKRKGVQIEYVTLHVGLGTFAPVKVDNIKKHKMHSERTEVDINTMQKIARAKTEGGRVIAVGTTSARALEGIAARPALELLGQLCPGETKLKTDIDIFIYPGYKFKIVDALITNFHLPKSTLLMLVSAFVDNKNNRRGTSLVKNIYQTAIKKKYRFFSFGDAMLVI
ncbi:MAG: tRNA preQ1(34) S-adenosylmethionine ribosyltransferase-isomerase QueA [Patescibacteria group bacterium]